MTYKGLLHVLSFLATIASVPVAFIDTRVAIILLTLGTAARGDAIMREIRELKKGQQ